MFRTPLKFKSLLRFLTIKDFVDIRLLYHLPSVFEMTFILFVDKSSIEPYVQKAQAL